jgi:hypothetical protein
MRANSDKAELLDFAAIDRASNRAASGASEILSVVFGDCWQVSFQSGRSLDFREIQSMLSFVTADVPCLCTPLGGDIEGRLIVWPPEASCSSRPDRDWDLKFELIAETLATCLTTALADVSKVPFWSSRLRLKDSPCTLPEEWDGEAEAWEFCIELDHAGKARALRVTLVAPPCDLMALHRALCFEEAA